MMAASPRPESVEREAAHAPPDHVQDVALAAQEIAKRERIARAGHPGEICACPNK